MGAQRIQRENAAPKEDIVLRIAVVEAYEHRRRIVGHRAGGGDRNTALLITDSRRDKLNVSAKAAHRVSVKARIDRLSI